MEITHRLREERAARGWSQRHLAQLAGISRQSYAAIEARRSVPSTDVALRLARALAKPLDELFRLTADVPNARWSGGVPRVGARARVARVGDAYVAVEVGAGDRMARPATGIVTAIVGSDVTVAPLDPVPPDPALVAVGCDPAFGLVVDLLMRDRGVDVLWSVRGSRQALQALARGEAHIAGAHLRDPDGGGFNERFVRESVPFECTLFSFAVWEQCLLVAPGNPLGVETVADLTRPDLRLVNREIGAGSRALLDDRLRAAGVEPRSIEGYEASVVRSHVAVAEAVATGLADAGVGIRAAGEAYGLDIVPLELERYDLVVPNHFLDQEAVQVLIETLRRAGLRRQVEALGGYDTTVMGRIA